MHLSIRLFVYFNVFSFSLSFCLSFFVCSLTLQHFFKRIACLLICLSKFFYDFVPRWRWLLESSNSCSFFHPSVQAEYRAASMKAFLVLNGILFFCIFVFFASKKRWWLKKSLEYRVSIITLLFLEDKRIEKLVGDNHLLEIRLLETGFLSRFQNKMSRFWRLAKEKKF